MLQLRHEVEIENPKTKVKSKVTLEGAQDFFVLPLSRRFIKELSGEFCVNATS